MNRRGFLGILAGATAAIIAPELVAPKTIFLPPRGGWPARDPFVDYLARYQHTSVVIPIKFTEPDPALFELMEKIERDSAALTGLPMPPAYHVEWVKPRDAMSTYGRTMVKTRLHEADLPGDVLPADPRAWDRLVVPAPRADIERTLRKFGFA